MFFQSFIVDLEHFFVCCVISMRVDMSVLCNEDKNEVAFMGTEQGNQENYNDISQLTFTCSQSTVEALENGVKYNFGIYFTPFSKVSIFDFE